MARIKRGVTARKKHRKLLKRAKGFTESRRKRIKTARETVLKAETYARNDRRKRKGSQRRIWITQISAALSQEGLSYSKFASGLKNSKIELNRKMLAALARENPEAFKEIVAQAKTAAEKSPLKPTAK